MYRADQPNFTHHTGPDAIVTQHYNPEHNTYSGHAAKHPEYHHQSGHAASPEHYRSRAGSAEQHAQRDAAVGPAASELPRRA